MSSSTPSAPSSVLLSPILIQTDAPSSSPTISSQSQTSPSMPSSSSSQPRHAHSVSPSESNERQVAEARTFLAASMNNIGCSLDQKLQDRAKNLHGNSKVLERQQKDVGKATEGLRKENDKLSKMANEGSKKIKELGNVQNWAEMLERDFLVLGEWVRLVDGGGESESSWTESEGEEEAHHRGHASDEAHDTSGHAGIEHGSSEQPGIGDAMILDTTGENGEVVVTEGKGKLALVDTDGDAEMWDSSSGVRHEGANGAVVEQTAGAIISSKSEI